MNSEAIKAIQAKIGAKPDGDWGPKSTEACRVYLQGLLPAKRFPTRSEIATNGSIFGRHGTESYTPPTKSITLPFPIYYEGKAVTKLSPHEKCADTFLSAFQRLYDLGYRRLVYDGLYSPRKMRGSASLWSMHAWAIAIDLDAEHNLLSMHWPRQATMPFNIIEAFAKEGLWSLGGFESRDAMHFEATNGR